MTQRGRRSAKQLREQNVSTADMTRAEYDRSNDDQDYVVKLPSDSSEYHVHGIHSARAVAGANGTFKVKE